MDEKTIARFWAKVDRNGPVPAHRSELGPCWVWTAFRDRKGYGGFSSGTSEHRAHRIAWMLCRGAIPVALCVLHRCDNPSCVRPDHLWLGTKGENAADRDTKGRTGTGARNGMALLSDAAVQEIRLRYRYGNGGSLAREFGVSRATISYIVTGGGWRSV